MCHIQYTMNGDEERISGGQDHMFAQLFPIAPNSNFGALFLSNKLTFLQSGHSLWQLIV